MRIPRLCLACPLAGALLILSIASGRASGQTLIKQFEPYRKTAAEPGAARGRITEFQEGKVVLSKPTEADLAVYASMAQYLVNRVTHHEFYQAPNEATDLKPRPVANTVQELLNELRKYLLIPPADGKINLAQEDYIREFGAALDKALVPLLIPEKGKAAPPPIIRVNAGRLLVLACESGAPAHWPTVTALLKSPETPPELLYSALKAAEGLLGGFDVSRQSRLAPLPADSDAVLYDLVHILEVMVEKGPPILNKLHIEGSQSVLTTDPKDKTGESLLPDQVIALQLYRLQAIRALARLRTDILGGKVKPALEVRPLFTLARVAIGDPAITPAFNRKEVAEAVIGLVRVTPTASVNLDELAYAVSYGSRVVFAAKATNPEDNSLPWKGYAGRMNAAFQDWQAAVSKRAGLAAKQKESINLLVKKAADGLFNPVLNPTAGAGGMNAVKLELIDDWQRDNKPANGQQLFADAKSFLLVYPTNR